MKGVESGEEGGGLRINNIQGLTDPEGATKACRARCQSMGQRVRAEVNDSQVWCPTSLQRCDLRWDPGSNEDGEGHLGGEAKPQPGWGRLGEGSWGRPGPRQAGGGQEREMASGQAYGGGGYPVGSRTAPL